jgi:hypothetical protein
MHCHAMNHDISSYTNNKQAAGMNLEENSLAVTAGSAADVLVPGQSGVSGNILENLCTLRGGVVHLVVVDAVVLCDLLNRANRQGRIDEIFLQFFTRFRWSRNRGCGYVYNAPGRVETNNRLSSFHKKKIYKLMWHIAMCLHFNQLWLPCGCLL